MVYGLYVISPETGLFCLRRPAIRPAGLDSSVGESGPHDFAVRLQRARLARQGVHRIPRPYTRDDRVAPLLWARDGAHHTPDFSFWKSEIYLSQGIDTISENPTDGQISCVRASFAVPTSRPPQNWLNSRLDSELPASGKSLTRPATRRRPRTSAYPQGLRRLSNRRIRNRCSRSLCRAAPGCRDVRPWTGKHAMLAVIGLRWRALTVHRDAQAEADASGSRPASAVILRGDPPGL
jgi:hypothetical protein